MNTLTLTPNETRDIEDDPRFELIEEGNWDADDKYQYQTNILKDISTGKFYSCSIHRSGSPFTDYYYSWEDEGVEMVEVEKKTKIVETWEAVK